MENETNEKSTDVAVSSSALLDAGDKMFKVCDALIIAFHKNPMNPDVSNIIQSADSAWAAWNAVTSNAEISDEKE